MEGVAKTERLAALFLSDDSMGPPTVERSSKGNSRNPVATEPPIDPTLRTKIEAVHDSVSGHFGVEYTRKVLLGRGGGGGTMRDLGGP